MFCSLHILGQNSIILISLQDKDTIDYKYPVFNWTYTQEFSKRDQFKYNLTIVELKKNQSANTGIGINQPLVKLNDIQGYQWVYAFDAPELKFNNRYGWQIEKTLNGLVVDRSEAWEFILYKKINVPMKYAILNTDFNATTYEVTENGFYFKLKSKYPTNNQLKFEVMSEKGEIMEVRMGEDKKEGTDQKLENTNDEFLFLNTSNYPVGTYLLKITDQKRNSYNTRFIIK